MKNHFMRPRGLRLARLKACSTIRRLTRERAFHTLAHAMTNEQARVKIWKAIKAHGVKETAAAIGRKERTLYYFAAGGGMSATTAARLRALFPRIPAAAWLAAQSAAPVIEAQA